MKTEKLGQYYEILELDPGSSLEETRNAYVRLKKLYSTDSIALKALGEDFTEEKKGEILQQVEEAYKLLAASFEPEKKSFSGEKAPTSKEIEFLSQKPTRQSYVEQIFNEMEVSLKAKDLRKSYNRRMVAKDVNIEVKIGEIIALLGRNGAGKTTTFQMIVGLIKPESGSIIYSGKDISSFSPQKRAERGITYLPQENSVFIKTSVENNLKMVLELKGYGRKKQKRIARQLLEELDLLPLSRQSAHSLSGGERRRLEICRALAINPKFLLLDEPFTGIDPMTIIDLQKILARLKYKGIGIILSDHNVRDTLRITDRAYIIDEGNILVEGSPKEIIEDERAKERFLGKNFSLGDEITFL